MPTVAVIGGGFSGLLTALHLLRSSPDLQVRLIERSTQFGRGRAYATANGDHLLNVRTGNMSAFPDEPDHFRAWLGAQANGGDADGFVSRGCFGDYLQAQLREAVAAAPGRLLLEADEIVSVRAEPAGGWTATSWMGRPIAADAVVLAVGLLPPHPLPGVSPALLASDRYFGDPWTFDHAVAPEGPVLLAGAGLTMIDVALGLERAGRRMFALSRRGLLPRRHSLVESAPAPEGGMATPLEALRTLRAHAERVGWREAVDGVRPQTQAVWQAWSLAERRRFLRHVRPWWEVHRHRMAPAVAARLLTLTATGGLEVAAGRIQALDLDQDGGVVLRYRSRSDGAEREGRFAAVVNCTGPQGDLGAARDPLLAGLRDQGLIRADVLRLGLDVDGQFRAIGVNGRLTAGLFAVGPLTRSAFWESVAVPDLRNQAKGVAACVVGALEAPERGAVLSGRG